MWGNNIVLPPCAGIVLAEDLVTSPLPAIQEFGTGEILSGAASPTTSKHSSTAVTTGPTTHHTTAKSTTEPPTTPHHNITNSTTEAPTTPHHNITNSTTEPPTTPHHNVTNSTTEAPTTPHHNVTNSTTEAPTTTATTPPPPTTPPVPNPTVGNYSVKSDNVTVCLLAKMGLQFSFKMSAVGAICLCRGTQELKFLILCEAITHLQVLFCCFLEFQLSDS